jgi:hypothetical protein
MLALAELHRVWPSVELPGYREHPAEHATYSHFAFDALPPIRRTLDDELLWLLDEPVSRASLAQFEAAGDEAGQPDEPRASSGRSASDEQRRYVEHYSLG